MVNAVVSERQRKGSQLGFTLVEFMVAFAVGALILVGALMILRYTVVTTGNNADRTIAQFQAHYVSFWIGEDAVQAQEIVFGNTTGKGFPLSIAWEKDDGNHVVTYDVGNMTDERGRNLWQLTREHKVMADGNEEILSSSLVAEYLDPELTECYREIVHDIPEDILVLKVAAKVDEAEESSSYEINPRYTNVNWVGWE